MQDCSGNKKAVFVTSGDYCFDGMNTEEAHREIKKNFDDFQAKIARGLVE